MAFCRYHSFHRLPQQRLHVVLLLPPWPARASRRCYTDSPMSLMRHALKAYSSKFVGVGQLAARLPDAYFPAPKPFGLHAIRGSLAEEEASMPKILQGSLRDARSGIRPSAGIRAHCEYAVAHEFPWFPLFVGLAAAEDEVAREALARSIVRSVRDDPLQRGRRWWFAYELFFEPLSLPDVAEGGPVLPFLPPERFFCTVGITSLRHGILDNLLGNKEFCPFVEKFAGAADASERFKSELLDVLSPICMMTVKEFLKESEITLGSPISRVQMDKLMEQLAKAEFKMSDKEREQMRTVFGVGTTNSSTDSVNVLNAAQMVDVAKWLRGESRLAARLREHLLGVTPMDLRWHAPGEMFLDRLSRVISSIETRASQLIEGELPPEKKERFFVDLISKPWNRDDVQIDTALVYQLQQGLLSANRFSKVCETQVDGEPQRTTQNWISSEREDDMVGKEKVLHYLPPPPETLSLLYKGYFDCVNRMLDDPQLDPIVCATVAKIALNTLHPMADGNGRVQRMLFQLILFKFKFLPRVNVPVSVIMLRDRSGYEVLQQGHVDQIMAGLRHHEERLEGDAEDSFLHSNKTDGIVGAYQYQDFTFAVSCMMKLMQNTLPVIAAKAYFLRRFDWRVDELLKNDALLPPRAATKIAKAFKNDPAKHGLSYANLLRLLFLDGWWIGFRRIGHFLNIAQHPDDRFGLKRLRSKLSEVMSRSNRRNWPASSGQLAPQLGVVDAARGSGGKVRWVSVSLDKFSTSELALRKALAASQAGDTVLAVNYPMVMHELITDGVFPELSDHLLGEVQVARKTLLSLTKSIAAESEAQGVFFSALVGDGGSHLYKPASALCHDLRVAEVKPARIYVGYDKAARHHKFIEHLCNHSPCDVSVIKDAISPGSQVRWVGMSSRNLAVSSDALRKALEHSKPGDTVVAVHYPTNPFSEEGLSSLHDSQFTSVCDDNLDVIMDSMHIRILETAIRVAEECRPDGVVFKTHVGIETLEPHVSLVRDATQGVEGPDIPKPCVLYVGYSERKDRSRLVNPSKLHDVAEHLVHMSPCNVVLVKTQEAIS